MTWPTIENDEFQTIELTSYEQLVVNTTRCGDFNVLGVSILESKFSDDIELDSKLVRRALEYMQVRHPLFRSHQQILSNKDNEKMYFKVPNDYEANAKKYADMIELEWLVPSDSSLMPNRQEMTHELEVFNDKMFTYDNQHLMWRFKVIGFTEVDKKKKYAMAISVPLQIIDGICMTTITLEIVNIVNALKANKSCEEMTHKFDAVAINLHTLSERQGLFGDKQKQTVDELSQKPANSFTLNEKFKSNNEQGTKIYMLKLNKDLTSNISSCAKSKQLRLTGYFNAVAYYALRDLYVENGIELPKYYSCEIPANLRLRYEPGTIGFGELRFQVTLGKMEVSAPEFGSFKDIWKDAKLIHERIQECTSVQTGTIYSLTHNFDYLNACNRLVNDNDVAASCQRLHTKNKCDLLMSNVGQHVWKSKKLDEGGPFEMSEIYFGDSVQSNPCILPPLMFHILYWNGEIMIQLSCNRSSMNVKYSDRYFHLYEQLIKHSVM